MMIAGIQNAKDVERQLKFALVLKKVYPVRVGTHATQYIRMNAVRTATFSEIL
jgi:hypothetical protein